MRLMIEAATQQLYGSLRTATARPRPVDPDHSEGCGPPEPARDRGAVSLEQVLWFVAVGVSVAVVATILWTQVIDTANDTDNIIPPTTP